MGQIANAKKPNLIPNQKKTVTKKNSRNQRRRR